MSTPRQSKRRAPGAVRIIGGLWRRRRIGFEASAGIRPTPDRVRETVFNWLGTAVVEARCLDLFAGSGAFGFEAMSRGATHVVLNDARTAVAERLRQEAAALGGPAVEVQCADALQWLKCSPSPGGEFDIVFLDPPYESGLLGPSVRLLEAQGWLTAGALVYFEQGPKGEELELPENWTMWREKRAGRVRYHLASRDLARARNRV